MTEVLYPETSAYLIVLFLVSVPLLQNSVVDPGEGPGGGGPGSPLFLDQNETRKVHPPLPALLKVWIHHWNVCIHLCVNKYQCAPCIGFTVSKGKKYKVCRLLRSSGNRLRMSLNNYSEIYISPPSPSQCHKPPGRLCSIIPLGFTQEEKRK